MQQKRQKQRKQKKIQYWILWLICLVLLIATGAATFAVWNVIKNNEAKQEEQTETVEVNEAVEVAEENNEAATNSGETTEDETNGGKKVKQFEGGDPNKLDYLTGVVTTASVSGENLIIRTNIDQYLSAGKCELQILRGGGVVYQAATNIIPEVSTSTCEGFDVPLTLVGNGNLQIIINISSGEKTGTMNSEVNI